MDLIFHYLNCRDFQFGFVPAGNALGVPELNVKIPPVDYWLQ
jgi:hypothetical protein